MIKKLDYKHFDEVFHLMDISFPEDEFRTYEEQKSLLENPLYQIYVLKDSNSIQAFLAVWEFDSIVFIEHFVVNPAYRNCGIGSKMLQEFVRSLGKMACLEVEPPDTDLARRRIDFYKRNHFFFNSYPYIQPSISEGRNAIPLFIMTSERSISEDEFLNIKELLYTNVYHRL